MEKAKGGNIIRCELFLRVSESEPEIKLVDFAHEKSPADKVEQLRSIGFTSVGRFTSKRRGNQARHLLERRYRMWTDDGYGYGQHWFLLLVNREAESYEKFELLETLLRHGRSALARTEQRIKQLKASGFRVACYCDDQQSYERCVRQVECDMNRNFVTPEAAEPVYAAAG